VSLRTKLTVALLLMGLAAISFVGLTARTVMLTRFDEFVVDRAVEGFLRQAEEYYREYGSWEAAAASESFFDFTRRTAQRPAPVRPPQPGAVAPDRDERPDGSQAGQFALGGEAPPFAITNREGEALVPLAGLEVGDRVAADRLPLARPIMDEGVEIALAVPLHRPVLTELEERYLSAMRTSWMYSLLLASALAIPVGLFLGDRLSRSIRDVADAMDQMKQGRLHQQVPVRARDEVGHLARSFNEMSRELAKTYDELEASRAKLDLHARELAELSQRDSLTGLLNRRGFAERANAVFAQSKRYEHDLCVAMLDVDHFKRINDLHSHAVGDQVLIRIAEVLNSELRESDLLGRWGGEEFALAFPETSLETCKALAERLRSALETHDWSRLIDGTVTVSIGVCQVDPEEGLGPALARADERLYRAKELGRNRVEA
jgi:diguanylate cyclase (GGDEF)-like protein